MRIVKGENKIRKV